MMLLHELIAVDAHSIMHNPKQIRPTTMKRQDDNTYGEVLPNSSLSNGTSTLSGTVGDQIDAAIVNMRTGGYCLVSANDIDDDRRDEGRSSLKGTPPSSPRRTMDEEESNDKSNSGNSSLSTSNTFTRGCGVNLTTESQNISQQKINNISASRSPCNQNHQSPSSLVLVNSFSKPPQKSLLEGLQPKVLHGNQDEVIKQVSNGKNIKAKEADSGTSGLFSEWNDSHTALTPIRNNVSPTVKDNQSLISFPCTNSPRLTSVCESTWNLLLEREKRLEQTEKTRSCGPVSVDSFDEFDGPDGLYLSSDYNNKDYKLYKNESKDIINESKAIINESKAIINENKADKNDQNSINGSVIDTNKHSVNSYESGIEDDDSSAGSFWDLQNKLNISDGDWLQDNSSPGTFRLTKEGLERHEMKAFKESLLLNPGDSFDAWKKRREVQLYWLKKQQEKHKKLLDRSGTSRKTYKQTHNMTESSMGNVATRTTIASSGNPKSLFQSLTQAILPHQIRHVEDVNDVSLAPMNTFDDIKPPAMSYSYDPKHGRLSKPCKISHKLNLFKRPSTSEKAKQILEKERNDAEISKNLINQRNQAEKDRIRFVRQTYLAQERMRECAAKKQHQVDLVTHSIADTRSSIFVSMEVVKRDAQWKDSINKKETVITAASATETTKTKTTATSSFHESECLQVQQKCISHHQQHQQLTGRQDRLNESCSQDLSTITELSSIGLPNCVVCKTRKRSHISLPCMHFSYCDHCVASKLRKDNKCVVCSKKDVVFAPVSV